MSHNGLSDIDIPERLQIKEGELRSGDMVICLEAPFRGWTLGKTYEVKPSEQLVYNVNLTNDDDIPVQIPENFLMIHFTLEKKLTPKELFLFKLSGKLLCL